MLGKIPHVNLRLPLELLLVACVLSPAGALAAVTTSRDFTVAPFAAGLRGPTALAVGSAAPFEGALYALDRNPAEGTGRLLVLAPDGQVTVIAEGLRNPTGLVVSPGGAWGTSAYVVEGARAEGSALRVLPVTPAGPGTPLPIPPSGTRVAGGVTLSLGRSWGEALYLSDAGTGELLRLDPTGTTSVVGKGLPGPRALALAPAGSPFPDALYVVAGPAVLRLGPDGQTSALAADLGVPGAMAFGPGDAFGTDLYLVEGGLSGNRILRLSPNGTIMPVAEGFGVLGGLSFAPAGPLGPALFVAEYSTGTLYRITPVNP